MTSMQSKAAILSFVPRKDCFISVPKSWSASLNKLQTVALKIENCTGNLLFTTWSGSFISLKNGSTSYSSLTSTIGGMSIGQGSADEVIEISGLFASKQNFINGQLVHITILPKVSPCRVVHVVPSSADDWEILEMNSREIEFNLLHQVRLVTAGLVIPIWVQKSTCIFVKIESVESEYSYSLLESNTQVSVSPILSSSRPSSTPTNILPSPPVQPSSIQSPAPPYVPRESNDQHIDTEALIEGCDSLVQTNQSEGRKTVISRLLSVLNSTWFGEENSGAASTTATSVSRGRKPICYVSEICESPLLFSCRVLALEGFFKSQVDMVPRSTSEPTLDSIGAGCRWSQEILKQHRETICTRQEEQEQQLDNDSSSAHEPYMHNSNFSTPKTDAEFHPNLQLSTVYIHRKTLRAHISEPGKYFLAHITRLVAPDDEPTERNLKTTSNPPNTENISQEPESQTTTEPAVMIVRVILIGPSGIVLSTNRGSARIDCSLPIGHILVPLDLRRAMRLETTGRVLIASLTDKCGCLDTPPRSLLVFPLRSLPTGFTSAMLSLAVKNHLKNCNDYSQHPLLLNRINIISCRLTDSSYALLLVTFSVKEVRTRPNGGSSPPYCLVTWDQLESIEVKVAEDRGSFPMTLGSDSTLPSINLDQLQ